MEIIFLGALISVFIALDTTHLFQSMISQPIFACPLIGVVFGEPTIGLVAGLIFEVSFLKSIPVGAAIFPENTIGSLSATIYLLAIKNADLFKWELFIPASILLGLFVSFVGMHLTIYHRKSVEKQLHKIEKIAGNENTSSLFFIKQMATSLTFYIIIMYLLISVSVLVFYFLSNNLSPYFSLFFNNINMLWWICAFLFVGFARLMNQYLAFKRNSNAG